MWKASNSAWFQPAPMPELAAPVRDVVDASSPPSRARRRSGSRRRRRGSRCARAWSPAASRRHGGDALEARLRRVGQVGDRVEVVPDRVPVEAGAVDDRPQAAQVVDACSPAGPRARRSACVVSTPSARSNPTVRATWRSSLGRVRESRPPLKNDAGHGRDGDPSNGWRDPHAPSSRRHAASRSPQDRPCAASPRPPRHHRDPAARGRQRCSPGSGATIQPSIPCNTGRRHAATSTPQDRPAPRRPR